MCILLLNIIYNIINSFLVLTCCYILNYLIVVLMWKMELALVLVDHHWTVEAHPRQLVWCFKICHSVESRSCTDLILISKFRQSPCPGTRPLPVKGKYNFIPNNTIFSRTTSDIQYIIKKYNLSSLYF